METEDFIVSLLNISFWEIILSKIVSEIDFLPKYPECFLSLRNQINQSNGESFQKTICNYIHHVFFRVSGRPLKFRKVELKREKH